MNDTLKSILLYLLVALYAPITIVRVSVASLLLVDLWATKVISKWLKEVDKEIEQ